jgi:hypothetical protein
VGNAFKFWAYAGINHRLSGELGEKIPPPNHQILSILQGYEFMTKTGPHQLPKKEGRGVWFPPQTSAVGFVLFSLPMRSLVNSAIRSLPKVVGVGLVSRVFASHSVAAVNIATQHSIKDCLQSRHDVSKLEIRLKALEIVPGLDLYWPRDCRIRPFSHSADGWDQEKIHGRRLGYPHFDPR